MRYVFGALLVLGALWLVRYGFVALRSGTTPERPAASVAADLATFPDIDILAPSAALQRQAALPPTEPHAQAGGPMASEEILLPANGSMLIRRASATIEVDSLERAVESVRALADAHGGYVANSVVHARDGRHRTATVQLRVPSDRLDRALGGLTPLGRLETLEITSQDVGDEYVDVQARISNARTLEDRLLRLIERRTGKLEEILRAERELARVREAIERLEARRRFLEGHTTMSTLSVTLREPAPVLDRTWTAMMGGAARQAWRHFWELCATVVEALGILVPLGVLVLVGVAVARRAGWLRTAAAGAQTGGLPTS